LAGASSCAGVIARSSCSRRAKAAFVGANTVQRVVALRALATPGGAAGGGGRRGQAGTAPKRHLLEHSGAAPRCACAAARAPASEGAGTRTRAHPLPPQPP
jgi:hypothetical protein